MSNLTTASFTGDEEAGSDEDRLRRRTLWLLPSGLVVVGSRVSRSASEVNLMTANLVFQAALEPKVIAVSLEKTSRTLDLVRRGEGFSISVLHRDDRALIRRFVKPATDIAVGEDGTVQSIATIPVGETPKGLPVLSAAIAWIECASVVEQPFSSHVVVFGEVSAVGSKGDVDGSSVLTMADTKMNYGG